MKGKKYLLAIITGCVTSCVTTALFAGVMSVPNGWYLEGNIGASNLSNTNFNGSSNSSGLAGNINFGYKFMPYLAAELGVSEYANTSINDDGNKVATLKHYSYDLAGKGIVPIADSGVEAFAKLGVARNNAHISITNSTEAAEIGVGSGQHSSTGLYIGAGAQYYFIPEFAAILQWQRATGSDAVGNEDLFSLGLSYLFS